MPNPVLCDAKIGARTWKTGGETDEFASPACMVGSLLRTPAVTSGDVTWVWEDNVFDISAGVIGNGSARRGDVFFGLSNRVRSVTIAVTQLGTDSFPLANNRIKINLWRIDTSTPTLPLEPTDPNGYPVSPVLIRAIQGGSFPNAGNQTVTVNISDDSSNIRPCGFCIHLEARAQSTINCNMGWSVAITPSQTAI